MYDNITIQGECQEFLARRIEDWRRRLEVSRRHGQPDLQVGNWLFGLQLGLDMLGLYDLARLAEAAQNVD